MTRLSREQLLGVKSFASTVSFRVLPKRARRFNIQVVKRKWRGQCAFVQSMCGSLKTDLIEKQVVEKVLLPNYQG